MKKLISVLVFSITGTTACGSIKTQDDTVLPESASVKISYADQFNHHLTKEDVARLEKYQESQMSMMNMCIEKVGLKVGSSPKDSTKEKRNAFLGCVTVEYLNELKKYNLPDNLVYWALTSATQNLIMSFSKYDQP